MAVTIHGAGCCLMDYLYTGADFSSPTFEKLMSRAEGDGGLIPGGLVFAEHLAEYAGRPEGELIEELSNGEAPNDKNVGGPAIVSLIHTSQVMPDATVRFFGQVGSDDAGKAILNTLSKTPLDSDNINRIEGPTAATHVFSDPNYNEGDGERLFVNQLGVADSPKAGTLPPSFFEADIVQLGGTALVPPLHADLTRVLQLAQGHGALTVVNTVYDFMAESQNPNQRWTIGSDESYPHVDLIISDLEEARRLTGETAPDAAINWFLSRGAGAAIVTCGADPVWYAKAGVHPAALSVPVFTGFLSHPIAGGARGDTTGCGDNFCGGVVAEIAAALEAGNPDYSLEAAVKSGIAAGAYCLTYVGGTRLESKSGEKRQAVAAVRTAYEAQPGR